MVAVVAVGLGVVVWIVRWGGGGDWVGWCAGVASAAISVSVSISILLVVRVWVRGFGGLRVVLVAVYDAVWARLSLAVVLIVSIAVAVAVAVSVLAWSLVLDGGFFFAWESDQDRMGYVPPW